jgi:hypothetical protein
LSSTAVCEHTRHEVVEVQALGVVGTSNTAWVAVEDVTGLKVWTVAIASTEVTEATWVKAAGKTAAATAIWVLTWVDTDAAAALKSCWAGNAVTARQTLAV